MNPKSDEEDRAVISAVLGGDKDSFAALVEKYQGRVRGFCRHVLGDWANADDAAQEVFIKAYSALPKFRAESSFSTWLYSITSNHCKDVLRRLNREASHLRPLAEPGRKTELNSLLSLPAESAVPTEHAEILADLLHSLPFDYRQIIVFREAWGLSYQELADTLGVSVESVRAKLKRARAKLEERMRHLLND